jgi:hypothetical protein
VQCFWRENGIGRAGGISAGISQRRCREDNTVCSALPRCPFSPWIQPSDGDDPPIFAM